MKVSIITAVYNAEKHIESCIQSVLSQTYSDIEYIIIDGASSDKTVQKIEPYKNQIGHFISEPDKGMYDAMNKGLALASGDIIGILNSDDFFANPSIVEQIVGHFTKTDCNCLYGDIQFVSTANDSKIVRHYSGKNFRPWKFWFGYMPPHLSFYAKKEVYETYGHFKTSYRLCADFDLLVRLLYVKKLKAEYLNLVMVHMRMGGRSNQSLKAVLTLNKEILKACLENGIRTNIGFIYLKYFTKVFELLPALWRKK